MQRLRGKRLSQTQHHSRARHIRDAGAVAMADDHDRARAGPRANRRDRLERPDADRGLGDVRADRDVESGQRRRRQHRRHVVGQRLIADAARRPVRVVASERPRRLRRTGEVRPRSQRRRRAARLALEGEREHDQADHHERHAGAIDPQVDHPRLRLARLAATSRLSRARSSRGRTGHSLRSDLGDHVLAKVTPGRPPPHQAGISNSKTVRPGLESTVSRPSIRSASSLAIVRPRPEPWA